MDFPILSFIVIFIVFIRMRVLILKFGRYFESLEDKFICVFVISEMLNNAAKSIASLQEIAFDWKCDFLKNESFWINDLQHLEAVYVLAEDIRGDNTWDQ